MIRPSAVQKAVAAALLLLSPASALGFAPSTEEVSRPGWVLAEGQARLAPSATWSTPASARAAWARFEGARARSGWRALWDEDLGIPLRVIGPGIATEGADAEATARQVLFAHLELFAPGAEATAFSLIEDRLDPDTGLRTVSFQQRFRGMEVVGGQIGATFRGDRLVELSSEARPGVQLPPYSSTLDDDATSAAALAWLGAELEVDQLSVVGKVSDPVVLATFSRVAGGEGRTRPAYHRVRRVVVRSMTPAGEWDVYVEASGGRPVARLSRLRFFDATLQLDVPDRYPLVGRIQVPASTLDITIDGTPARTSVAGRFSWVGPETVTARTSVRGEHATVSNAAGLAIATDLTATSSATLTFGFPDDEAVDAQIAAYYATDFANRYVGGIAPGNRWVQIGQVPANVNLADTCNAYSDGRSINFYASGRRCENTARILDVVMHEYGHTVHAQSFIRGQGSFDTAMSEGLSDYLAATITDDSGMGRGFFRSAQALRELDPMGSEARWPEDVRADPHETGLIYAGALWDLRKSLVTKLGERAAIEKVDDLWYAALERASSIPTTYAVILVADDDDGDLTNGTPNYCEIVDAFDLHGLADPADAGPTVGPVNAQGFRLSFPVREPSIRCSGSSANGAELIWRRRGAPDIGGRIPLTADSSGYAGEIPAQPVGEVIEYRVEVSLDDGQTLNLPQNPASPYYEMYVGETTPIYCTDFESSPWDAGWTHALVSGNPREGADDWMWAEPMSPASSGDPTTAYSGSRLVGNDLGGGNYNGQYQADKVNELRSPVFDVSGYQTVRLQYRRWLSVEDGYFDKGSILADGTMVWTNLNSGANGSTHHEDREWRFHDVDLTAQAADGQVQLTFQISSDGGLEFGGWSIDDLCVVGVNPAEPVCGNGTLEGEEACDDGNLVDGDGCQADCTLTPEPMCGNGAVEGDEACDDGNLVDGDGCEADCTLTPPPTETCDDGSEPPCAEPTPTPADPEDDGSLTLIQDEGCGCSSATTRSTGGSPFASLLLVAGAFALLRRRRS